MNLILRRSGGLKVSGNKENPKMAQGSSILKFMSVLLCLFVLAGCDRSAAERDKALAQEQKLKAELAKVQTALEEIQDEADKLRASLAITSDQLQNTKSKLAEAMQAKGELEYRIAELTKQKDAAIADGQQDRSTIDKLNSQLKKKDAAIRDIAQWNSELQFAVRQFEKYVEEIDSRQ
jgi:septal ring factor EnvC (AmiA/AmiB activator)